MSAASPEQKAGIPGEALRQIVCSSLRDQTARITRAETQSMEHEGWGGEFFRAAISWEGEGGTGRANWVVKHWRCSSLTGAILAAPVSPEAEGWRHGLLCADSLPEGLRVPYVGVALSEDGAHAWIAMDDIASELTAFRFPPSLQAHLEAAKLAIDKVASFHASWEAPERLGPVAAYPWLIGQERYLSAFPEFFSKVLAAEPAPGLEGIRAAMSAFFDWLPRKDRGLWEAHVLDAASLVAAFAGLPRSVLHGDLDKRNIGVRRTPEEDTLFLIDWEWMSVACPAIDVAQLLFHVEIVADLPAGTPPLEDLYLERYRVHGGSRYDRAIWEKAYELGLVREGLRVFPYLVGGSILGVLKGFDLPNAEVARRRVPRVTEAMRKWLR